jgi:ADP-dependent NAD(P)H-hydrate dehydratase / NAD(P)H-hydrate epimerase
VVNKVVTADEMRQIEQQCVRQGTSLAALMERAGHAVAQAAARASAGGQVVILVGPGNNGGDGLIAANVLRQQGYQVVVYSFHRKDLMSYTGRVVEAESDDSQIMLRSVARESHVIVDALLGIGSTRPPEGLLLKILRTINEHQGAGSRAIAVDIPTGVDADTGAISSDAFQADQTLCMGFLKYGVVLHPGAAYAGQAEAIDVGIAAHLADHIKVFVPTDDVIARLLPKRSAATNKGVSGRLMVVGGSHNYMGAPALVSVAAYRAGAGLIEAAVPRLVQQSVAAHVLEAVFRPLPEADGRISTDALPDMLEGLAQAKAMVYGPGMGLSEETVALTKKFLTMVEREGKPALIDADGLNALAETPDWWSVTADLILTPPPGEMARLTGLSVQQVQGDRPGIARGHAAKWRKIVVLKGAGTVVAAPDGTAAINPTGGSNLATAGTGDVLSGIIGGLLAQGCASFDAAVAGTYLHGRAGDLLRTELGDAGTLAGDLVAKLPIARLTILNQIEESL